MFSFKRFIEGVDYSEHHEVGHQLDAIYKGELSVPDHVKTQLIRLNHKPTYDKAVASASLKSIHPVEAKHIGNHTYDKGSIKTLDQQKVGRVASQYKAGKISPPIILHHRATGHKHLLAGNTRLTYGHQALKQPVPALHIHY